MFFLLGKKCGWSFARKDTPNSNGVTPGRKFICGGFFLGGMVFLSGGARF